MQNFIFIAQSLASLSNGPSPSCFSPFLDDTFLLGKTIEEERRTRSRRERYVTSVRLSYSYRLRAPPSLGPPSRLHFPRTSPENGVDWHVTWQIIAAHHVVLSCGGGGMANSYYKSKKSANILSFRGSWPSISPTREARVEERRSCRRLGNRRSASPRPFQSSV